MYHLALFRTHERSTAQTGLICSKITLTPSCPTSVSGLPEATITVTEKKIKEVMTLEDETFSKFYRPVEEIPASSNKIQIDEDFDAIFGPQVPR